MSSYHLRGDILSNSTLVQQYEQNAQGYSKVPLGEFNAYNRMGDWYPAEDAIPQIIGESRLNTNIRDGALYGEVCHPPYSEFVKPGVSERDALAQWLNRLSIVDSKLISHHISEIIIEVQVNGNWITPTAAEEWRDLNNKVRIWGWVKEFGPYGQMVADSFKTPSMNTYFSLRSIVKPTPLSNGRPGRCMNMYEIYTYDFVLRGGYGSACKWKAAPGLEHYKSPDQLDAVFKIDDMIAARNFARLSSSGLESDKMIGEMDRVIDEMQRRHVAGDTSRFQTRRTYGFWNR